MPFILVAVGVLIGVALTVAAYRWLPASRSGVLRPAVSVNAVEDLPSNPAPDYGRLALDGLRDGVVLADRAGQIQIRNARAESPTGTHHGDALINASVQRRVTQTVNGEATHESVELLDPARRVFRTSASPLPGGGVIVTISDVTEQARLDAVRTDFVANISHELKTPVGAMSVLAEALADEDDPETSRRLSGKVLRETTRLSEMIDDLLELSRIELGGEVRAEPVVICDVISQAIDRIGLVAERRHVRVHVGGETDLKVTGDPRQLVSAVANLLDNAVKYSGEGSTVDITANRLDTHIAIEVADDGIGIGPQHLERIFERFYRVDRARSRQTGGTGLGLAIVRHVAVNHGGDVSVRSEEGAGSTFTLRLPIGDHSHG